MKTIEEFIQNESSSGILLIFTTIFSLALSNTFMLPLYESFLHIPVEIRIGSLHLDKSLYHWVNDGLMAIFFLLIGLEVKREIIEGHLSSLSQIALPGFAAVGGMVVPAAIYLTFNQNNPLAANGWAIPTATDIAFALGIISLLGNRVPTSLKLFLMALAFTIPLNAKDENNHPISPLKDIEHNLHFWVAFFILPLFAFVNAGVNVTEISFSQMSGSVPLGIMLGLFIGKQLGVFGFSWVAIKLKIAKLPEGSNWMQLYGVSVLTGIGFTMSLFIVSLAFEDNSIFQYTDKLAILVGSFLSGMVGYLVLKAGKNT